MAYIVAGLGNYGSKYDGTRHNVGFMLVDYLAGMHRLEFSPIKWQAFATRSQLWGEQVWLVKPQTYMNRSGISVAGVADYYNVESQNILVVHDDLDMNVGRIKLVDGGGAGGHKGIKSIVQHLGTPDFFRLKIGIGRPGNSDAHPDMPVEKFVVAPFSKDEATVIEERISNMESGIRLLIEGNVSQAMNVLNCLK